VLGLGKCAAAVGDLIWWDVARLVPAHGPHLNHRSRLSRLPITVQRRCPRTAVSTGQASPPLSSQKQEQGSPASPDLRMGGLARRGASGGRQDPAAICGWASVTTTFLVPGRPLREFSNPIIILIHRFRWHLARSYAKVLAGPGTLFWTFYAQVELSSVLVSLWRA